ncbi:hypothetical protein [Hyphomicrobium sp.]|uniref:hypothetical protein n=1 Tax=Hyphomicrobium sp. TaxID=82 RepID=UPI0025C14CEB|nr:hypothetical protein [Hyphomicrobium sp.]MCC7251143.1 hypothetical protein [Hyphomicrobium sp.]
MDLDLLRRDACHFGLQLRGGGVRAEECGCKGEGGGRDRVNARIALAVPGLRPSNVAAIETGVGAGLRRHDVTFGAIGCRITNVIPAKAGIHASLPSGSRQHADALRRSVIPAFAGMTSEVG